MSLDDVPIELTYVRCPNAPCIIVSISSTMELQERPALDCAFSM